MTKGQPVSQVQTVSQVVDPLKHRPVCVAKGIFEKTGVPCTFWFYFVYMLAITMLFSVEVVPRVFKGSRWTRCSECSVCCCCLCCGTLSEESYQSVRRALYATEEMQNNHEEPNNDDEHTMDDTYWGQIRAVAMFVAHNHPLGHVWHHREDAAKMCEKIFVILLALLLILPDEARHKILSHEGEAWNQLLCGLSDGFYPLLQGATNFCLYERALDAIFVLLRRGTGCGKCLGGSSLAYLILASIMYTWTVFNSMASSISVGKIILICFKVVLLAMFVVDVILLVIVFFLVRLAESPLAADCAPALQPPGSGDGGGDVEFATLSEPDTKVDPELDRPPGAVQAIQE